MKTIYIPTEEELKDIGFTKEDVWYKSVYLRDEKTVKCEIVYDEATPAFYVGYFEYYLEFHPTSKQGLLDFISNFSPNE